MTERNVIGLYKELKGVLASLNDAPSWFEDKGFAKHANYVIDRATTVCPDIGAVAAYRVTPESFRGGRVTISTTQATQKLNSLIGRIEGEYDLKDTVSGGGNTFIQNQSQSQTQQIVNLVLEMQEKILSELPKHQEGSKERTFLEKIKQSLPTVKTTTDILSSALKIGADIGLDPGTIHKLLGL